MRTQDVWGMLKAISVLRAMGHKASTHTSKRSVLGGGGGRSAWWSQAWTWGAVAGPIQTQVLPEDKNDRGSNVGALLTTHGGYTRL
jgi:hypothetical protein